MTETGRHGLLLALMEPQQEHEDEFNDWYDLEHIPQMSSVPGVLTATRWICVGGWPRYLALYDLEHIDVLSSDEYRQATGAHFTPWSRRILGRVRGWRRLALAALDASAPLTSTTAEALDLVLFENDGAARWLAEEYAGSPALLQARAFAVPDHGLAAAVAEARALVDLPRELARGAEDAQRRGFARFVRYHRTDPFAAFRAIAAGEVH